MFTLALFVTAVLGARRRQDDLDDDFNRELLDRLGPLNTEPQYNYVANNEDRDGYVVTGSYTYWDADKKQYIFVQYRAGPNGYSQESTVQAQSDVSQEELDKLIGSEMSDEQTKAELFKTASTLKKRLRKLGRLESECGVDRRRGGYYAEGAETEESDSKAKKMRKMEKKFQDMTSDEMKAELGEQKKLAKGVKRALKKLRKRKAKGKCNKDD